MTLYPSTTNSINILQADDARIALGSLVDVKNAARLLGVSKSTIYRMDRKHGLFRFVSEGRRIFIDAASFELHMAQTRVVHKEAEPQNFEDPVHCQQEEKSASERLQQIEMQAEVPNTTQLITPAPPSRSGGQRGLIFREWHTPKFGCYLA
jgi:excisionase family DNA binding protein